MASAGIEATTRLGEYLSTVTATDIPARTRQRAALVIADSLGVGIRGATTELAAGLIETRSGDGRSGLLAPGFPRTGVGEAAFLNAVALCSTELDEGIRPTGHPAMHVLPPLLALAQERAATGADLVTAFVVGYEVQARIQRAARLRAPIHCHGNYGHPAAAAALAHLTGLDGRATIAVLNGAAGFASATSYSLPYAGATMHSAAPSLSGSAALLSLRLVGSGYRSHPGSVAEVFGALLGTGFDAAELTDGLGERWAIDESYTKFHSTCGHAHPVLDALIDALGAGGSRWRLRAPVDPDSIAHVKVGVAVRAAELSGTRPQTPLAGRFSIPFATATMLARGVADVDAFEGDALRNESVLALADRVRIVARPEYDELFPSIHRADVEVVFRDGTRARGRCDNPYGNAMNPATGDDVRAKFDGLLTGILSSGARERVWDAATGLDRLADVRALLPAA